MSGRRVPDVIIRRLPLYLRVLEELDSLETPIISSHELGVRSGVNSGQIRKDLSVFGVFGKQGVGYNTLNLREELRRILRLDKQINMGLIGAGNLGKALIQYNVAREKRYPAGTGIKLVAAFDNDERKIGQRVAGVEIYHTDQLAEKTRQLDISLMLITTPAPAAEGVLDLSIRAGVRAFLNFAPVKLMAAEGVRIHSSDFTLELESLAYFR